MFCSTCMHQVNIKLNKLEEKKRELQEEYDKLVAAKDEVIKDVTGLRKGMKMRVRIGSGDLFGSVQF